MLISQRITDLFGGVSQAPSTQRGANQWTELVNSLPIFGKRLGRRPPLLHLTKLLGTAVTSATSIVHAVSTSTGRRVQLILSASGMLAFDADTGVSITVLSPDGPGSFGGTGMRAVSNGDTTIITNPATVVAKASTLSTAAKNEGLVYVRQGDYSTNYTVVLAGVTITYVTPDTTAAGAKAAIATDQIAIALQTALLANATLGPLFYITLYGSTLYIVRKDAADFTITSADGIADKGLVLIKGSVQRFTDLPPKCRTGVIVQVTGDNTSAFTSFYVRYVGPTTPSSAGQWLEVVKPGVRTTLDASTLPYRCVFRGNLMEPTAHLGSAGLAPLAVRVLGALVVYTSPDNVYPPGCPVVLTVEGTPFTYTVGASPMTAAQLLSALMALVAANVTYVVVQQSAEQYKITRADAAPINSSASSAGFNAATTFFSATPLPAGLVGQTIKNVTDGSSGTVTAVDTYTASVVSLSGGVLNLFTSGDLCTVVGAGDYFVFGKGPWAPRAAGDDTTVPFPSLVGTTISEVFFHQGRLGFLSGSTMFLSRAGAMYGLFRSSAVQILSDDPIDLRNMTGDSSPFHSGVEWNSGCYIFSGLQQYLLDGGGAGTPITPSTVRLKAVSKYLSSPQVRPIVAGNRLYFVALKSGFPRVLEYSIKGYEQLHNAEDTGRDLPTYFQGNVLRMVLDETQGVLLLLTDTNSQKTLYCLSYRFTDGQKVASGWGKWTFNNPVVGLDVIDGHVAVLTTHSDGTYLNQLLLDPQTLASVDPYYGAGILFGGFTYGAGNPAGMERITYLDRRVNMTTPGVTVSFAAGVTTWTLPYTVARDGSEGILAVCTEQFLVPLATSRPAPNQVSAVGDYRVSQVYIGVLYTTSWTFSTLVLRDKDGVAEDRGRLQLRWLHLFYTSSSDLTVSVTAAGRLPVTTTLAQPVGTGELLIPIQAHNTDTTIVVSNTTSGAGHLVSYAWEGTHHTRERAL